MGATSFAQTSFLGGEWSQSMQGRFDRQDYRWAMNVCLNSLPVEQGAWTRRPGTIHAGFTRSGQPGRVIGFDFKQSSPYTIELTDGHMRFRTGPFLVISNAIMTIAAISTDNPAKVTTTTPHGWATGDYVTVVTNFDVLQRREFIITVTSATEFTIVDAQTGLGIDGSSLGILGPGGIVARILDIQTPYVGGSWATVRLIQTDLPDRSSTNKIGAIFLHTAYKPYLLTVETAPPVTAFATFSFVPAVFKDGPYFDPVAGGALATPSALLGNISITLAFNAYSATRSYSTGDYVTYSAVNYKSKQDANLNHQPDISPTFWQAVSAGDAVGPNGFITADIGRMIRLFSEPAIWDAATTYAAGNVVAFGGAGLAFTGASYWRSLVGGNIGNTPGVDATKWLPVTGAAYAVWTWGRIIALSNVIAPVTGAAFGDMTLGGGLAAAFDGNFTQTAATSAEASTTGFSSSTLSLTSFVGKNFSGVGDQAILQATIYPSTDQGIVFGLDTDNHPVNTTVTINLRGKTSAPVSSADGTLLGTTNSIANTTSPVTIISTDQVTAWKYVWIEVIGGGAGSGESSPFESGKIKSLTNAVCELSLVNPAGTGTATGVTVQVVGDALLYTTPIRTWRLGVYSDTIGWPTCGTYHEGRLWLSGVIPNRIDASKSNDILNFAPTAPDGTVAGNNGITYTFNSPEVNPLFWLVPDYNGIIGGTQAGEWLVQATNTNVPLTPTTIQAHRVTTNQCANIEPRRTEITLAIVQNFKRSLLEYFGDVYSGKFGARDLTENAKHLTVSFIQEIAYQQEVTPIIWARMGDGSLCGVTYRRQTLASSQPAEMQAWHRHALGSGRTVESISMGATIDGTMPALAMVTFEAGGLRHVELMSKIPEEVDALETSWYLDDAVNPTRIFLDGTAHAGAPYGGMYLFGLWHLNGKSPSVFAGGLYLGEFTVTDGSAFVPYGDGVSEGTADGEFDGPFAAVLALNQVVVGFKYNSDGQIVRPATPIESGAHAGPALGKTRRSHMYGVQVANTAWLQVGTTFAKLYPQQFKTAGLNKAQLDVATGVFWDALADDYSFDGMLCWRVDRPLPATVVAVSGFVHTQDR